MNIKDLKSMVIGESKRTAQSEEEEQQMTQILSGVDDYQKVEGDSLAIEGLKAQLLEQKKAQLIP
jgi:hypothetical protein